MFSSLTPSLTSPTQRLSAALSAQRATQPLPISPTAIKPLPQDTVRFGHYKDDLSHVATRDHNIHNHVNATDKQKQDSKALVELMNKVTSDMRTSRKASMAFMCGVLGTTVGGPAGTAVGAGLGYFLSKADSKNPDIQAEFRYGFPKVDELDIFKRGKAHFIDAMTLNILPAGTYHYYDRFGEYKNITMTQAQIDAVKANLKKVDQAKHIQYLSDHHYFDDCHNDPDWKRDWTLFQPLYFVRK